MKSHLFKNQPRLWHASNIAVSIQFTDCLAAIFHLTAREYSILPALDMSHQRRRYGTAGQASMKSMLSSSEEDRLESWEKYLSLEYTATVPTTKVNYELWFGRFQFFQKICPPHKVSNVWTIIRSQY